MYYLVGAAGFPNYGDELIAATWLRHLARVQPRAEVWVDCPHPGTAQVLLDGLHPGARFVDTLWRLCWLAPSEEPLAAAAWVQQAVHNPGLGARWAAGIELLARADVVHVIGGGYVNAMWPRHLGVLAGAAAAATRSGGRSALTGLGLCPASPSMATVLQALADRFDVVDTRDEASAELLGRPGTSTCDDVVLGLPGNVGTRQDQPRPYMLCLQSDLLGRSTTEELAGFALATLRSWKVDSSEVGVVEGIPGHDRVVYSLIEHELPGAQFLPFTTVWADGLPTSSDQVWLSTRFHVHLVAAASGAHGVALSPGGDYYGTKHRSLTARGSGWTVIENLSAVPDRPTGAFDPAALVTQGAAKVRVADAIYGVV